MSLFLTEVFLQIDFSTQSTVPRNFISCPTNWIVSIYGCKIVGGNMKDFKALQKVHEPQSAHLLATTYLVVMPKIHLAVVVEAMFETMMMMMMNHFFFDDSGRHHQLVFDWIPIQLLAAFQQVGGTGCKANHMD
jgi:hypothetical protein